MADQETKFSEEELKSLQDLQTSYQQKQLQFGQSIEATETQLEVDYVEIQETERNLVKELNKKYGPGNLDPATGVFTPTPVEDKKAV
jgi:hypothetical protein